MWVQAGMLKKELFPRKLMNKCSLSDSYKHSNNMNPLEGFLRFRTGTLGSLVGSLVLMMKL